MFRRLIIKIRKAFKTHSVDLIIKTSKVKKLDSNEFYVNAYYDQDAEIHNECAIEIYVFHNFTKDNIFEHTQLGQFLVQIYDAVVHEFKHQEQARSRKFKPNARVSDPSDTVAYLSDPDEIDAYALSIAIELIRNLGRSRSITYLHRASRLARIRPQGLYASPTLFHYFRIFDGTHSPILRKLIKKIFLNLQSLDKHVIFY